MNSIKRRELVGRILLQKSIEKGQSQSDSAINCTEKEVETSGNEFLLNSDAQSVEGSALAAEYAFSREESVDELEELSNRGIIDFTAFGLQGSDAFLVESEIEVYVNGTATESLELAFSQSDE